MKKVKINKKVIIIIVLLIIAVSVLSFLIYVALAVGQTKKYNSAVMDYNNVANTYNSAVSICSVDNIEGFDIEAKQLEMVDEGVGAILKSLFNGNSLGKMNRDTNEVVKTKACVENYIIIIKQITTPTGEWIIERLNNIDEITGAERVTADNDPEGMLSIDGGYQGCVYFSSKSVNQSIVPGDSIIGKGTDGGGAIEVYKTADEANARCEYLSQYDGTLLYSGSYALLGTMVIRTSYLLDDNGQRNLTDAITKEFTRVYDNESTINP